MKRSGPIFGARRAALHRTAIRAILLVCSMLAEAAIAGPDPYRVGPGDTLSINAYGDLGLTGQFIVGPDGSIGYPLLGNFDVLNRTTGEIDDAINQALGKYVTERRVTVSVSTYAPVYIVGDVDNPGRYEFHPGMTGLELLAMSGGHRKDKNSVDSAQIQLVQARQDYSDLTIQIFSNQVRHERLQAEIDGKDFDYVVGNELDPLERDFRQRIIDSEANLFKIRQANFASQKASLENQRTTYDEEVKVLLERTKLYDDEIALLEQDVAATKSLVERGLTAKSNQREIERQLSASRRDTLEQGAYLARAKQASLDIAQRIAALKETQRADAANEIRQLDLDTFRKQKQMSSLLDRMAAISTTADALRTREVRAKLTYEVVRPTQGGFQKIEVEELTELRPRDILRVTLSLPEDSAAVTTTGSLD